MDETSSFVRYYKEQMGGGAFPVFVGTRTFDQRGGGIGDFFRAFFRKIAPVAISGATRFMNRVSSSTVGGTSLKDAALTAAKEVGLETLKGAAVAAKDSFIEARERKRQEAEAAAAAQKRAAEQAANDALDKEQAGSGVYKRKVIATGGNRKKHLAERRGVKTVKFGRNVESLPHYNF